MDANFMRSLPYVLFLGALPEERKKRFFPDALFAVLAVLGITGIIYALKLYPRVPNISIIYLLIVLAFASTRGLYSAMVTALAAFWSFDYFLVHPLFTFAVASFEEWLALFIFLVCAILTGELASALRQRAEQATLRANETLALYELIKATTSEAGLERQLDSVARAIVSNFAFVGIRDCAILMPDVRGQLVLLASACQPVEEIKLSPDEEKTIASAMLKGDIIDLYGDPLLGSSTHVNSQPYWRMFAFSEKHDRLYIRIIPLRLGQKVVGSIRLLVQDGLSRFPIERNLELKDGHLHPQTTFFWTFLDQATAMIERSRLQREALRVELLQQTDSLRSALLSSVSHDLRTPLASIKASASSLLQDDVYWDDATLNSFALSIESEADRLNRLVSNLLDMSRIEGGALKPEKEWYPLDELIYDVLGRLQTALQGRLVHTFIPDDLPPVPLDYLHIDQVVTNLIENVLRYTPVGSPIDILLQVDNKHIMVSMADEGPGVPPMDLERIFDKFYRVSRSTRKSTSIMGTGLGLAVCRGLIEAHSGHIWAENRPTGGALFRFTLPLASPESLRNTEGQIHE